MSDLAAHIAARRRRPISTREGRSREVVVGSAGSALAVDSYTGLLQRGFESWASTFKEGLDNILQSASNASGSPRYLHNVGISKRREAEQFMSSEGGDHARQHLGYINDDGVYVPYNDEQWSEVIDRGVASHDGTTLEGHHGKSMKYVLENNPEDLSPLSDPDNVMFATREGHLGLHGGSFQDDTSVYPFDVTTKRDAIIESRQEDVPFQGEFPAAQAALIAGLLAGSISAIIKLAKLRDDPRPWKQKAVITTGAFMQTGGVTSVGAYVAFRVRSSVVEYSGESAAFVATELTEALVAVELSGEVLAEALGVGVGLQALIAIKVGFDAVREIYGGASTGVVLRKQGKVLLVSTGQLTMAVAGGIIIDAMLPIPDPVVGPAIVALRVAHSAGKFARNKLDARKSRILCQEARMASYHRLAASSL